MDFDNYREYPVLGDTIFGEPVGGYYGWTFFLFTVVLTVAMLVDRGVKVGLLAGGGLILLAIPNVLPSRYYRLVVALRIIGILCYVTLWVAILVFFPNVLTFFEGDW